MNRLLQIADAVDNVFLSMAQMLAPLSPEAHELQWRILDLGEVVPHEATEPSGPEPEPFVDGVRNHLLTFKQLSSYADSLRQVIDGLFAGCESSSRLPSYRNADLAILEQSDMMLAAFDSTFWRVRFGIGPR
jgi:hypothetical protein